EPRKAGPQDQRGQIPQREFGHGNNAAVAKLLGRQGERYQVNHSAKGSVNVGPEPAVKPPPKPTEQSHSDNEPNPPPAHPGVARHRHSKPEEIAVLAQIDSPHRRSEWFSWP